jgi:hypothetical protein
MEAFLGAIFNPGNAKFELGDHDLVLGPIFITTRINPIFLGLSTMVPGISYVLPWYPLPLTSQP